MDKIKPFLNMTKVSIRFFALSLMRVGIMTITLVWIYATNTIVHGDEMESAIAMGLWSTGIIYVLTEAMIMLILGADLERVERIMLTNAVERNSDEDSDEGENSE